MNNFFSPLSRQLTILFFVLACLLFANCARQSYYAPSLKEAQPITMPVADPYTDIQIFSRSYKNLAHSDSLSALANSALQDLLDGDNPWNLRRLDMAQTARLEPSVKAWAAECFVAKDIAEVKVPEDVIDYMKASGEPYLMFLIQEGVEHDDDSRMAMSDFLLGRNVPKLYFQAVVADAINHKTAYYKQSVYADMENYSSFGVKPSDPRGVEIGMYQLLSDYPDKQTLNAYKTELHPRNWEFIYAGVGTLYANAQPGYVSQGCEPAWGIGMDILPWTLFHSPFSVGFGFAEMMGLPTTKDADGNRYLDYSENVGLEMAYNKIFRQRHTFTLMMGLHYTWGNSWQLNPALEAYCFRSNGLAVQASLMYHYRINANNAWGIRLNAQSLLHDSPLSNPQSPIDNCLIAVSYLMTYF